MVVSLLVNTFHCILCNLSLQLTFPSAKEILILQNILILRIKQVKITTKLCKK